MASSRQLAALAVLALALAFLAGASVASAARPAPAASGGGRGVEVGTTPVSYLQMYPAAAVVEKARETVEMLMARLPAGSSPKGPGH
ncbi:unnamed protein product [Miscanthus lutarioriparius]|uniref:Uncharacterized protein n=1 Tax=Miscanthus lutarioriparius TaxID=422564 RepID=A0A811N935_9POAL|nr:unnamed protein product [Miscanthus lutarioriparius]